ncbi:hypothetical protein SBRCBS47491_004686 [Sporothrix bragantina]|uniref:Zn(2)-C6 fungal-type domain-containing protein n=1 Tax=Sporothrix bragantina TaxID=671064 RepID=A0ABP0BQU7_9PEZI
MVTPVVTTTPTTMTPPDTMDAMEVVDATTPPKAPATSTAATSTAATSTPTTTTTSSASATKKKAFSCLFCARLFNRSDSLKRHWTTCAVRRRQALETPQVVPKTRGRKPQACDRCCRLKRACTFTDPCETCVRSKRTCTYTRVPVGGGPGVEGAGSVPTIDVVAMPGTVFPVTNPLVTTTTTDMDDSTSPASSSGTIHTVRTTSVSNASTAASTNTGASAASIVGENVIPTATTIATAAATTTTMDASPLPLFSANEIDWILDSVDMDGVNMGSVGMSNLNNNVNVNASMNGANANNLDLNMNLGLATAHDPDLMNVLGVGMAPNMAETTTMAMVPMAGTTAMTTAATPMMPTATAAAAMMPQDYMPFEYVSANSYQMQPHQQQQQQQQPHQHQQQQQQQHPNLHNPHQHIQNHYQQQYQQFYQQNQQQHFQQSSALMQRLIRRPTEVDLSALCEFSFLERITRTTGLVDSFHCGSQDQRRTIAQAGHDKILGLGRSSGWSASDFATVRRPTGWSPLGIGQVLDADENTRLLAKTHDIVSQIREASLRMQQTRVPPKKRKGKNVAGPDKELWSPAMEALCYEFFRPANIHTCLALFWSFWYPNSPTVHGPSFEPATAPAMLLASMVLVGACLAPDERGNGGRRGLRAVPNLWFDAVEEMVFQEDQELDDDNDDEAGDGDSSDDNNDGTRRTTKEKESCQDCDHEDCEDAAANNELAWQNSTHTARRRAQVARLQAAFLVCLYQTWEGAPRGRRRARQTRYTAVIALARAIGLSSATLQSVRTDSRAAFDWDEYILRESLIRTVSYIFDLDSAYALFYRHPPRMVLPELQTDLASPESCYRAATADACFAELVAWRRDNAAITGLGAGDASSDKSSTNSSPVTIAAAVQTLCHGTMTREVEQAFSRLSVLNMFTIVSALYAMTFRVETSLLYTSGPGGEAALIQTGLRHWIRLWPSPYRDQELYEMHAEQPGGSHNSTGWPRAVGFIRHAPEYCLVAFFILARIRSGANDDGLPPVGSSSVATTMMTPNNPHASNTATPSTATPTIPAISNTVSNAVRSSGVKNVNCAATDMALLNALVTEFRCRKSSSYCSRMLRQFCPPDMPERNGVAI